MARLLALALLVSTLAPTAASAQYRWESATEARLRAEHSEQITLAYGLGLGFAGTSLVGFGLLAAGNDAGMRTAGWVLGLGFAPLAVATLLVAGGMDIGAAAWSEAPAGRAGRAARADLSLAITLTWAAVPTFSALGGALMLGGAFSSSLDGGRAGLNIAGFTSFGLAVVALFTAIGLDIAAGRWAPTQFIVSPSTEGLYLGVEAPL
jgi:hypothetical protein